MFRVAKILPLTVVAPVPWFPMQGILRKWKPGFRPAAPSIEVQDGIEVRHPRFLSVPGAFKWLDGFFMALACLPTMLRLKRYLSFQRHRCPFRLSGRLRGVAARTMAARAGHDHIARHGGAARARPIPTTSDCQGVDLRATNLLGVRLAEAPCDQPRGRGRQDPRCRKRRRQRQISPRSEGCGAARAGVARGRAGTGLGGRIGRAKGFSPGDGVPAGAQAALSRTALPGRRWPEPRRRLEPGAAAAGARAGIGGLRRFLGSVCARPAEGASCRQRMYSCWRPATKDGPTCFSRRWPAAFRSWRPTSAAMPKLSPVRSSARWCPSVTGTSSLRRCRRRFAAIGTGASIVAYAEANSWDRRVEMLIR